jgi:hypothetical protein
MYTCAHTLPFALPCTTSSAKEQRTEYKQVAMKAVVQLGPNAFSLSLVCMELFSLVIKLPQVLFENRTSF